MLTLAKAASSVFQNRRLKEEVTPFGERPEENSSFQKVCDSDRQVMMALVEFDR